MKLHVVVLVNGIIVGTNVIVFGKDWNWRNWKEVMSRLQDVRVGIVGMVTLTKRYVTTC